MMYTYHTAMTGVWCSVICSILLFNNAAAISRPTIPELTQDNFQQTLKEKKCMFLYATEDDCEKCRLLYYKFITVSQTFGRYSDIAFGRFSDKALAEAFDIKEFPAIVFYEFGSAVPKTYLGDVTVGALTELVTQAAKENAKKVHAGYAVQLTKENFDGIVDNDRQYRLVMLHEADDEDEIAAFDELAMTFDNDADVVLARIDVDAEKYLDNKYIATFYPAFYWYPKGNGADTKKRYGGELRVDQMINFLNKQTGLQRMRGGALTPFSGQIKALDDVLNKHGKSLVEVRNIGEIKADMQRAIELLPKETDAQLTDYYLHLLDELEEDGTIETLGESRARLYRQMAAGGGARPLTQDLLARRRNIVQKFIDIIGKHVLAELSNGDVDLTAVPDLDGYDVTDGEEHALEFHDEF